jgi:hypothetical protein
MPTEETSERQQNAILRKVIKDRLGEGIWGLDKKESFTHEEILFLFARVFPVLGVDYVKEVRTKYPDCICVMDGKDIGIEFEPVLSSFQDHISKDDLSKCQYIVCWKNDLDPNSNIQREIHKHNIQVFQLRDFYEAVRVKDRIKAEVWTRKDFENLSTNQLKVLYSFIRLDKEILTNDEIREFAKLEGKTLGPLLTSFSKKVDWLVRKHPSGGWQFNQTYRPLVEDTLRKFPF